MEKFLVSPGLFTFTLGVNGQQLENTKIYNVKTFGAAGGSITMDTSCDLYDCPFVTEPTQ